MPYYSAMGDYYQGDNYAAGGLFGSIGKFLGGAVKKLGGTALSIIPGGGIAKTIGTALLARRPMAPSLYDAGAGTLDTNIPAFRGGGFGRSRRMNVLNIKALRRAMRRAKGFERQARRVGSFFSPGKTYRLKGRARKRS